MGDFRVDIEAGFTVPNKKNAESTKEKVIEMLHKSGFQEKDFIIRIDRGELPAKVETVEEKTPKQPRKLQRRRKADKVVANKTRKRKGRKT
jgi:hypothetical protein